MKYLAGLTVLACLVATATSEAEVQVEGDEAARDGKVLPVFQVVKFPNDICSGTSRNGTCYTAEECSNKGGTSDGSCASGFGVCCVFTLSCGDSASENQTYIVQSSVTTLDRPCNYQICPCSTNICRIRFDFTTLVLASAVIGTTSNTPDALAVLNGKQIGDCVDDQFSITGGAAGIGSPVICGTNTGYHMIVDADPTGNSCHDALFNIGGGTTSRQWNILVTQYACGDYDNSGWPGCLQYYTATASHLQSFAFPTATTITSTVTHLSNQHYDICIRRASGYCSICYSVAILSAANAAIGTAAIDQNSFGVSTSGSTTEANPSSLTSGQCTQDYVEVPGANIPAITAIGNVALITDTNRICGRVFTAITEMETNDATTIVGTVCARHVPFRVGVHFDANEADAAASMAAMTSMSDYSGAPGGIIGFKLAYYQLSC